MAALFFCFPVFQGAVLLQYYSFILLFPLKKHLVSKYGFESVLTIFCGCDLPVFIPFHSLFSDISVLVFRVSLVLFLFCLFFQRLKCVASLPVMRSSTFLSLLFTGNKVWDSVKVMQNQGLAKTACLYIFLQHLVHLSTDSTLKWMGKRIVYLKAI